jgi:two-component system response regulator ArlR
LICEDEENIVSFLAAELRYDNYEVDVAHDGLAAVSLFASNKYDLVLLDIMLPAKNGLECLREMRKTSGVPIIMVTARKDVYDKVAFLNAGADDYVTKPFDTLELIARIKRNIGRYKAAKNDTALIRVEKDDYRAFILNNELNLTKTEFELFTFLFENKNRVKTRDEIIHSVFGDFYGESNVVDVNIKNIRAKILCYTDAEIISTVRGKGYVIRI